MSEQSTALTPLVCQVCEGQNPVGTKSCAKCGSSLNHVRRSTLLTALLTVCALANTVALVGVAGHLASTPIARTGAALADALLQTVFIGASLLGIAGMWHWKRWGVYLVMASGLLGVALSILAGAFTLRFVVSTLVLALIAYAVRKEWANFHKAAT
jgi:ribosomal protein L40E